MRTVIICIILGLAVGCGEKTEVTNVYPSNALALDSSRAIEPGVYTELEWSNGSLVEPPDACHGRALMSGDFAIYSETSGTYFNSITEGIVLDPVAQTVVFNSGLSFSYKDLGAANEWEITYGPGCVRKYKRI